MIRGLAILRRLLVLAVLALAVALCQIFVFLLRFEFVLPPLQRAHLILGVMVAVPLKLAVFYMGRLHRGWWTYVGVADLLRTLVVNLIASAAFAAGGAIYIGPSFPRSVYVLDFVFCFLLISGLRLGLRVYRETFAFGAGDEKRKGVLIYGAGWAGASLVRELQAHAAPGYRALGLLDDSHAKRGETILGVRVLGGGREAVRIVDEFKSRGIAVEEILIAMPSASGLEMREAVANCRAAGVPCRTLPSVEELLDGKRLSGQFRNLSVEDLLGRQPVRLEEPRIRAALANRSILVTGAAGSIGSELCRQIASFGPRRLVLMDQAESPLFHIDLELKAKFSGLAVEGEIGDIRDPWRVEMLMRRHAVDFVFHAAAYKHVPLMETHVLAAAENNILGTWSLAQAARACGVKNFVLISSDKAVNPTNVMGATKRAAELVVSSFPTPAEGDGTSFVAVRFGNVLGSSGSVVPVFQSQIASGGPVTVTHPEARRFFMTVQEAAQLVLQASTMGRGAEVFVLDMGELVRIADLARNMIGLAGYVPDEEIEIRYVGLRPGEKLYEELAVGGENIRPTHHEKIKIFEEARITQQYAEAWISRLRQIVADRDEYALIGHLKELIPEYHVSEFWASRMERKQTQAVAL